MQFSDFQISDEMRLIDNVIPSIYKDIGIDHQEYSKVVLYDHAS